jgi:[glutamine synthetase] adenylyltransferase / [glutamine synthetase]-adenylyl-L-tyrosine phosphorylase
MANGTSAWHLVSDTTQPDLAVLPSDVQFRDPEAAVRNLALIRQRVPAGVYDFLAPLLITSPDPDAAAIQFERLAESSSPELLRLLQKHPFLIHYAVVVFGYSSWLGETLIRNPDLFQFFLREKSLDRTHSREEFQEGLARVRSRSFETDTAALLARFKKREYVRIMLRDVLGVATLAETTAEISALADVLIEEALREANTQLQHRFGTPQCLDPQGRVVDSRFAVLSMGKLGGNELNYSSDIDLLYLYEGGANPAGAGISNREYFIRLAQQITELLSRHSREGPVFRIDLRLRPQGNEGEPAVAMTHAIRYYSHTAHDWELQAMIKARHCAGDVALAREFLRTIQPYVYREELNFVAIKTALDTRERLGNRRRLRLLTGSMQAGINVKLDRGGLRDIEFLVQCLQRVYGGSEAWLRSRGTMFALQKLRDKGHIAGKDFHSLTNAYEFLRNLEHRLQLRQGQQTHRLSTSAQQLHALARSITREGAAVPAPEEFLALVQERMSAVAEIYQRVIYQEQSLLPGGKAFELSAETPLSPENSYSLILQRLAIDSPELRELAMRPELSQHSRRNLDRFLSSAGTTSERYAAVLSSPDAVERALTIFEFSEYLTGILVRYPEEVALLEQAERPQSSQEAALFAAVDDSRRAAPDAVFSYLAQHKVDRPEALAILRRHYRRRVFLSGARDLFAGRRVFDSFSENTAAADAAVQAALAIADAPPGLSIMGLGRLGACEFDLLSDADVLFVADESCHSQQTLRAAERIMEALTAYTREGPVVPVDARLRPHGREGELVASPPHLETYFAQEAKPWEALTYLKLRHVAGDYEVANRALQAVRKAIAKMATRPEFLPELSSVRGRLERSEPAPNFKTGPGGIYDLDYLAGTLQAQHQLWLAGNLGDRLRLLHAHGLLKRDEFEQLSEAALFLRTLEHLVRLVTGRALKWLPAAEHAHRAVQKLLCRVLEGGDSFNTEMWLANVLRRTREIYLTCVQP